MNVMDVAYDSSLVERGDAFVDAWIWTTLPIVALPLFVVILLATLVLATEPRILRRCFWCALQSREVEVHFAARALGQAPCAVLSCSAFEPGHAVACHRRCLDASYRRQWPAPLAARDGGRP